MLAGAVLSAGTDTTRNQLAAAVQLFSEHPDQWAAMPSDVADAQGVVDEVMRHSPAIMGTARQPIEDVELLGVAVPAGTLVSVNTAAANRDPAVFADPDRFDIKRVGRAAASDVRRRHPLLPRRASREGRARGGARAAAGQVADDRAGRPGAVEARGRHQRSGDAPRAGLVDALAVLRRGRPAR